MSVPATQAETPLDDLSLARRIGAGDLKAFEAIMRRHNRMLYRAARSILRDDAEAEDCLQCAYLLAYRSIDSFAGRAKLSTWLARIVINEALARKRQAARSASIVPIEMALGNVASPTEEKSGPEREAMRREIGTLIERRIDALPEAFRSVFILRALEELSVEETAVVLDIPEATVRSRHFRARSLLRESLAREIDIAFDDAFPFAGVRCNRTVTTVLHRIEE